MTARLPRNARRSELMGDEILDMYLSTEPWASSHHGPDEQDRLRRFTHDQEIIHNLRLHKKSGHSVVFLASIKNKQYILKVFKRWTQPGPVFYPRDEAILITPLACESRAFARLASMGMDGTWAIRCYGWMKLSDTQFNLLSELTSTHDLSRWVIVKAYEPAVTNTSHIPEIYTNFEFAKRARILPQDVRRENYAGSKFVDLSSTLTFPCPEWSEFGFQWFYEKTTRCVFGWFPCPPSGPP